MLSIPFSIVLWIVGLGIFTFYSLHPDVKVTGGDTAFFTFISTQLPTPIPGLIMAAMLAAVMSTLDSGINSLATIWLKEFHIKYIKPDMNETRQVTVSRISTAVIGIIAVGIGLLIACASDWLSQTVVEASTIFYAFDAIVFPAFLYAVLSKRANSKLIWITAALLWGLQFGMITWYTLTKKAAQSWQPGDVLGVAGPISAYWILIPAILFAIVFMVWLIARKIKKYSVFLLLPLALFPLGYSIGLTLWVVFSNLLNQGKPLMLSFQWVGFPGIIAYIIIGIIGLALSKGNRKKSIKVLSFVINSKIDLLWNK